MSTWGFGILDDDFTADVRDEYIERFRGGIAPATIHQDLIKLFDEERNHSEWSALFWFALAEVQWECGVLDASVHQRVRSLIKKGRDLERWQPEDAPKRSAALGEFLTKLENPNPKPKKPTPWRRVKPCFKAGDCLALRLEDGDYGAAIVTACPEDDMPARDARFGMNVVVLLRWKGPKPGIEVFEKREWFIRTHHNWEFAPKERQRVMFRISRKTGRDEGHLVEVVGTTSIRQTDPRDCAGWSGFLGHAEQIVWQDQWDRGIREDVPMDFSQFTDPRVRQQMQSLYPDGIMLRCTPEQRAAARPRDTTH